ncbi:MAG TPA: lycopene beta-cyclase CrtY [Novosphingobium sp.]|nr:lycopene beta-cyclase CrtY [Novosphingobium sp.]
MGKPDIDIAILGGGLAGGLIALALAERRPDLRLTLVEQAASFGGNHLWSFFESDVAAHDLWLVEPLIAARWSGYSVHFPGHSRALTTPYRSVTSERLDATLRTRLAPEALLTGASVTECGQNHIALADGRRIAAGAVIDARGGSAMPHMAGGWQKFLGQTLRLAAPHGLPRPIVMDARVAQIDGYRFVYCLPFSDTEVFVEDTYYSEIPDLDREALRARIAAYAAGRDWQVDAILREEAGVLPVVAAGDFAWFRGDPDGPARAGLRAALFHPLTSYSLPDAVRFAVHLAGRDDLSGASLAKASYQWARGHWRDGAFYRMLAKMLFSATSPSDRYRVLERFYRLPEPLIERFYAGRSSHADMARILMGKPPISVGAAVAALLGKGRPLAPLDATR